ncbi:MAG TPA: phospholipase D-like domain-containing protein [Candidatus Paceibacterota bacterium]|nr:phospholipase D-like domain-containing protein [Candidatus Paceibacterota bacterium]
MSKSQIAMLGGIVLLVAIGAIFIAPTMEPQNIVPHRAVPPRNSCAEHCSLIVEPDDGIAPVINLIKSAKRSIDLVIYQLEDQTVESELVRAEGRGVAVRVILSTGYQGEPSAVNQDAFANLQNRNVPVRWAPDYFDLTHEKSMVIDGATALIMSFNLVPVFYPTGRDFGIIDDDANDVAAMEETFNDDWQGTGATASGGSALVWSPGSRSTLLALIASATESLELYNEEMADQEIIDALVAAALRGIHVDIVMTYSPEWKAAFQKLMHAGAVIKTYSAHAARYIHAKMIVSDGAQAFIGSENFSATSLDRNRELGVIIANHDVIQSLMDVFGGDWAAARDYK